MDRRKFLRNTTVAGLAIPAISINACNTSVEGELEKGSSSDDFELNELSIEDLQLGMESGKYSSRSITVMYLERIEEIDKNGPMLNSVIEVNPDALAIAESMDLDRKEGKVRGPLHGIPFMVKDNIDTADKMMTTAGSLAMAGHIAAKDSFVVKKLREAGAVLIGKTNLSEWANFRSTNSSSGWSSRGGQTKNPYILERNPIGSSSGSGVAVAANLCAVAIGTETDGSVSCPASANGLVGIKPTVGLISRSGIIPISHTQDTAGPMTRTVRDAAILLGVMAGIDEKDSITQESSGKAYEDYTQFLDPNGLKGKRIGIDKRMSSSVGQINDIFQIALEQLTKSGAEIVEIPFNEKISKLGKGEFDVLEYEFKDGLNRYLFNTHADVKSLKDVIEFNKQNKDRAMPYFQQEILESSEEMGDLDSEDYLKAVKMTRDESRKFISKFMDDNALDALSGITIGPGCSTDLIYGDRYGGDVYFPPAAAISGYPHITVPCGMVHRLPVGISFMAKAYQESELFKIAYAYEQISKNRIKPEFLPTFFS
ncbi:amidase [Bacteroidota bacterium]